MEQLFAPPDQDWQRLSVKFRSMRRLSSVIWLTILFGGGAVAVAITTELWWLVVLILVVGAVIMVLRWIVVGRNWASWGYAEREDDLYITNGVLFRTLITVPYGRMQLVEVRTTPLQRAYGLATVQLVTASASTDAAIPGLLPQEAARLRDRLTQLGESQASGL
jgi:membrane protein YdbS with pleckstrin-like domain